MDGPAGLLAAGTIISYLSRNSFGGPKVWPYFNWL